MVKGRKGSAARWRAATATLGIAALGTATGLVGMGSAAAAETTVDDATFVWGLNGYAQQGIFGPWTFKDLTGDVEQLVGSVSGGSQTEYVVEPQPATSMPVTTGTQKTPNAVKFTDGTGTVDPDTGAGSLAWTGSYTVNAYPAMYNAPNEIYTDPVVEVAADGSGELSVEFTLGAGTDMQGNPIEEQDFGRLTLVTFSPGSVSGLDEDGFRLTPDYQAVEVSPDALADPSSAQTRSCTASGGATGWWGSWSPELVSALPASVRPHFYSTGCGGMQDAKPALPIDVGYTVAADPGVSTPSVQVSQTELAADGTSDIVVTGTGFPQTSSTGTPGVYVAVGPQLGGQWWMSAAAFQHAKYVRPSFTGDETASGAKLEADGTFTVHFEDVAPVYTKGETTYDAAETPFAVITFATQGSADRGLDTITPLTFAAAPGGGSDGVDVTVEVPQGTVDPDPEPEPGEFAWSIDGGTGAVSLGTAEATPAGFTATGALRRISVTDTRAAAPAWSIAGQVSDFASGDGTVGFGGQSLGWSPTLAANTVGAVAGSATAPGATPGSGLSVSSTLASSPAGHDLGSVEVDATLDLLAPQDTPAGSYTATLTLTALS